MRAKHMNDAHGLSAKTSGMTKAGMTKADLTYANLLTHHPVKLSIHMFHARLLSKHLSQPCYAR